MEIYCLAHDMATLSGQPATFGDASSHRPTPSDSAPLSSLRQKWVQMRAEVEGNLKSDSSESARKLIMIDWVPLKLTAGRGIDFRDCRQVVHLTAECNWQPSIAHTHCWSKFKEEREACKRLCPPVGRQNSQAKGETVKQVRVLWFPWDQHRQIHIVPI